MHRGAVWLWGIFGFWYRKWIYNPLCDFIGPLAIVQITQLAMACLLLPVSSTLCTETRSCRSLLLYMDVLNRANTVCVCVRAGAGAGAAPQSVALGIQLGFMFVLGSLCCAHLMIFEERMCM